MGFSFSVEGSFQYLFFLGSRGDVNSRTMLLPLVEAYGERCRVHLYHTPSLNGILKVLISGFIEFYLVFAKANTNISYQNASPYFPVLFLSAENKPKTLSKP